MIPFQKVFNVPFWHKNNSLELQQTALANKYTILQTYVKLFHQDDVDHMKFT